MSLDDGTEAQHNDPKNSPALRIPNEILVEICRLNAERGLQIRHACVAWYKLNVRRDFIFSYVLPTFTKMFSNQPLFQHCALIIGNDSITCSGIPDDHLNDPPWPPYETPPNGAQVEIWFAFPNAPPHSVWFYTSLLLLFRSIWDRVDALRIDDFGGKLGNPESVSMILERCSHRIRKIKGINIPIWNVIYRIINPGYVMTSVTETGPLFVGHLSALEGIGLWVSCDSSKPKEVYALYEQIMGFCKRKKEIGYPVRVIESLPLTHDEQIGVFFARQLDELGVEVETHRAHRGICHSYHT